MLLVDTAGRLQNKAELMNELEKVVRVIRKVDATPHAVLLVLTPRTKCASRKRFIVPQASRVRETKLDGTPHAAASWWR